MADNGGTDLTTQEQKFDGGSATFLENPTNVALLYPSRFGWTASGGIADLLYPHAREQKNATRKSYRGPNSSRKRNRQEAFANSSGFVDTSLPQRHNSDRSMGSVKQPIPTNENTDTNGLLPDAMVTDRSILTRKRSSLSTRDEFSVSSTKEESTLKVESTMAHDNTIASTDLTPDKATTPNISIPMATKNDTSISCSGLQALLDDGLSLDILAYDRTRDGRCKKDETAKIQLNNLDIADACDALADSKSMVVTVQVQFQLEECSAPLDTEEPHMYSTSIRWDLTDPETPNPIVFATNVAQAFGLSYSQTWELAESIQNQLRAHINENFATTTVLPNRDHAAAREVRVVPHLYGEVTGFLQQGGTLHTAPTKSTVLHPTATSASNRSSAHAPAAAAARKQTTKQRSFDDSGRPEGTSNTRKHTVRQRSFEDSEKLDDAYRNEVRTRLRECSICEIRENSSLPIKFYRNYHCHLCRNKQPVSGIFGCGYSDHAYCAYHLEERLGWSDPSCPLRIEHCPVCSLDCECKECVSVLRKTSLEFKSRCQEQSAPPESALFVDVLNLRRRLSVKRNSIPLSAASKRQRPTTVINHKKRIVPRIPPTDFPIESTNDESFGVEYGAVFAEQESLLVPVMSASMPSRDDQSSSAQLLAGQTEIEDGSVDYCNVCKSVGNILCCDFCPRAFHGECLPEAFCQQNESSDDTPWECPSCRQEKEGLLSDSIDGSASFGKIMATFSNSRSSKDRTNHLTVLSIIHEMLQSLMTYDFGQMFESPVDPREIPLYRTIVKHPMDLGTIADSLTKPDGSYDGTELEDVILTSLRHIELVWHNCFIFNVEGSAVYKMAEVQMRRAHSIRQRSLDHLLSDRVKEELEIYTKALTNERLEFRKLEPQPAPRRPKAMSSTPQTRRKGNAVVRSNNLGRAIAVFDPEELKIVKIYGTSVAATNAINSLFRINRHECEWEHNEMDNVGKVRRLVVKCQDHPEVLLFGYRWVFLDDLWNGNIFAGVSRSLDKCEASTADSKEAISEPSVLDISDVDAGGVIEMVDGGVSYFFGSIMEALSTPGLIIDIPDLFNRLVALVPGAELVQCGGRMWRRKKLEAVINSERRSEDICQISKVEIVKEDVSNGGTTLVGFPDVQAAFRDWCCSVDASVLPVVGTKSIDDFIHHYLDSDRSIDGVTWRGVSRSLPQTIGSGNGQRINSAPNGKSISVSVVDGNFDVGIKRCGSLASDRTIVQNHAGGITDTQSVRSALGAPKEEHDSNESPGQSSQSLSPTVPTESISSLRSNLPSVHKIVGGNILYDDNAISPNRASSASTGSQSTETSRVSKVFDVETVTSPKVSPYTKSNGVSVGIINGWNENCQLALQNGSRDAIKDSRRVREAYELQSEH